MLSTKSRILAAAASLSLILVYFFPLWTIDLQAPQYPEGLGLNIWVNQITGVNQNDLRNINGLNHYIGMKEIAPDDIPELKYMPYITGFMIVLGLAGALTGRRKVLYLWLILFVALGIAGLVDFYLWGYEYGHNLNPDAPIKVPGMTYQPPLFGSKQLLNINAVSLPYLGTVSIVLAIITTLYALLFVDKKSKPRLK